MLVRFVRLFVVLAIGGVILGGSGPAYAQPDSVRTALLQEKGFAPDHSPTGALWRSVAVPGWGQFYNRQYYKMPFVYAGFAALGYRIYSAHQEYLLFKRAHLFGRGPELSGDGSNPYQQYQSQFNEAANRLGGERLSAMRAQRDQFRRQRDLAILGSGLFYALTVLDAYVSAHLLSFDVGDELSVRAHPIGDLRAGTNSPPGLGLERTPEQEWLERGPGLRLQFRF